MMINFRKILTQEKSDLVDFRETENLVKYSLYLTRISNGTNKDLDCLKQLSEDIFNTTQRVGYETSLTIKLGDYDSFHISNESELSDFDWEDNFEELEYSELNISLEIFKKSLGHSIYIFSLTAFAEFIESLTLEGSLSAFEKVSEYGYLDIINWDSEESLSTSNILIRNQEDIRSGLLSAVSNSERAVLISQRNSISNVFSSKKIRLLPSDFRINSSRNPDNADLRKIGDKFKQISLALSISFISDISSIQDNELSFKIKGLKTIEESINLAEIDKINDNVISDVYQWLVSGGSIVDKVGLIRNILSVHVERSLKEVPDSLHASISAGYDLYLKDNVKQYIEVRNKISEFVFAQTDKASDLSKSLYNGFKSNLWTLITFFISVVFLRTLVGNGSSDESLFSTEIYVISLVLIGISVCYFILSLYEVSRDKRTILDRLTDIESRYKDLVAPQDLKKIADTENLRSKIKSELAGKTVAYSIFWSITLLLFLLAATALWHFF